MTGVERDADREPQSLGIDVKDAEVISKGDQADAAASAAERGHDAHTNRAWVDARQASEDEDDVKRACFRVSRRKCRGRAAEPRTTGAVAQTGSAVKNFNATMLIGSRQKTSVAHARVEAARLCHQAVTNGSLALINLDREVCGRLSATAGTTAVCLALTGRQTSLTTSPD